MLQLTLQTRENGLCLSERRSNQGKLLYTPTINQYHGRILCDKMVYLWEE